MPTGYNDELSENSRIATRIAEAGLEMDPSCRRVTATKKPGSSAVAHRIHC